MGYYSKLRLMGFAAMRRGHGSEPTDGDQAQPPLRPASGTRGRAWLYPGDDFDRDPMTLCVKSREMVSASDVGPEGLSRALQQNWAVLGELQVTPGVPSTQEHCSPFELHLTFSPAPSGTEQSASEKPPDVARLWSRAVVRRLLSFCRGHWLPSRAELPGGHSAPGGAGVAPLTHPELQAPGAPHRGQQGPAALLGDAFFDYMLYAQPTNCLEISKTTFFKCKPNCSFPPLPALRVTFRGRSLSCQSRHYIFFVACGASVGLCFRGSFECL